MVEQEIHPTNGYSLTRECHAIGTQLVDEIGKSHGSTSISGALFQSITWSTI